MSKNNTAYTYNINPNGGGKTNGSGNTAISASTNQTPSYLEHQTSPSWVLTFMRWAVRDTLRTDPTSGVNSSSIVGQDINNSNSSGRPLVVTNDCIQVSVSDSKAVLTPSMTATLMITDVNYMTELAPGDFVFVNIVNWQSQADDIASRASSLQQINKKGDGFKGFFKVQSVRKSLEVDAQSGEKFYAVKITGFAFTEFNNSIYFNPNLINGTTDQNLTVFLTNLKKDWGNVQTATGITQLQQILKFLIQSFIGYGFADNSTIIDSSSPKTPNRHFLMPQGVGQLLGLPQVKVAADAYNFLFGIQTYSPNADSLQSGMNPQNVDEDATDNSRFIILDTPTEGHTVIKPEYWNQTKAWSILNQFTNAPLNELYTCFRVSPDGSVLPTMVFRQIPFTTDDFDLSGQDFTVTKFMSLPRWNINPALAMNFDLGRDEALRINFMQYYGISVNSPAQTSLLAETSLKNFIYDLDDVQRNGLRPSVITTEFELLSATGSYRSPGWSKIMGDALIGGHLKMSGSITFVGIPEPIAVGDNLQFDNVVYHIEEINHSAMIDENGFKNFSTTIIVSSGVSILSGVDGVVYSEMTLGSGYDKRQADYNGTNILPGVSESQDVSYRKGNLDQPLSDGNTFIQPNTNTAIDKSTRDS